MNISGTAILGMGGFGLFWGLVLVIVNKVFYVKEDPNIEKVIDMLPGVNCGACGYAGCAAFGEAIVTEHADIGLCTVATQEDKESIGNVVGRTVTPPKVRLVAKLHCNGSLENTSYRANYVGDMSCTSQSYTQGGISKCTYGCLGLGDCVNVCPFDALYMNSQGLPVVIEEKCTACGKCVEKCPRGLFKLIPEDQKVFIACSSHDTGPNSKKACKAACIGCGICAKLGDKDTFILDNNLALVNYDAAQKAEAAKLKIATEKCPMKIISYK